MGPDLRNRFAARMSAEFVHRERHSAGPCHGPCRVSSDALPPRIHVNKVSLSRFRCLLLGAVGCAAIYAIPGPGPRRPRAPAGNGAQLRPTAPSAALRAASVGQPHIEVGRGVQLISTIPAQPLRELADRARRTGSAEARHPIRGPMDGKVLGGSELWRSIGCDCLNDAQPSIRRRLERGGTQGQLGRADGATSAG